MKLWQLVLLVIGMGTFFIYITTREASQNMEERKERIEQKVEECKSKTNDIEWCFRTFYKI